MGGWVRQRGQILGHTNQLFVCSAAEVGADAGTIVIIIITKSVREGSSINYHNYIDRSACLTVCLALCQHQQNKNPKREFTFGAAYLILIKGGINSPYVGHSHLNWGIMLYSTYYVPCL